MLKRFWLLPLLLVLAVPGRAEQIDVTLSDRLEKLQDAVDFQDRRLSIRQRNQRVFVLGRERPYEDYARETEGALRLDTHLRRLLEEFALAADLRFDGTLKVHLDFLSLTSPPLVQLERPIARVRGTVTLTSPTGELVRREELKIQFVRERITRNRFYDGPNRLYLPFEEVSRPGPFLALVAERALEAVFPGQAEAIPGPVTFLD